MQSRPMSTTRPSAVSRLRKTVLHAQRPTYIAREHRRGMVTLANAVRRAPDTATQAMHGLGAFGDDPTFDEAGGNPAPNPNSAATPAATSSAGIFSTLNTALTAKPTQDLLKAGMTFIQTRQGGSDAAKTLAAQQALQAAQANAANLLATRSRVTPARAGMPKWVLPVAIVGGLAVVGGLFFALKK